MPLLPNGRRLVEPFVGAGSVFLTASYDSFIINDANEDLVAVWSALQARPQEFIRRAGEFFVEENRTPQAYGRIRAEFNEEADRFERAIRFVYLNKFGFNGLFRVNRRGAFNVPYGSPAVVPSFPSEQMQAAAVQLGRCRVMNGDFRAPIREAGVGDVLYCDPPYSASAHGGSFVGYTGNGFAQSDHEALVEECLRAVSRGAKAVISNHDTPSTRDLYRGWRLQPVTVRRSIGAASSSRGMAQELIAMLP